MTDEKKEDKVEVECPVCKHKFWHDLKEKLKKGGSEVLNDVGEAIGEAEFGGER